MNNAVDSPLDESLAGTLPVCSGRHRYAVGILALVNSITLADLQIGEVVLGRATPSGAPAWDSDLYFFHGRKVSVTKNYLPKTFPPRRIIFFSFFICVLKFLLYLQPTKTIL